MEQLNKVVSEIIDKSNAIDSNKKVIDINWVMRRLHEEIEKQVDEYRTVNKKLMISLSYYILNFNYIEGIHGFKRDVILIKEDTPTEYRRLDPTKGLYVFGEYGSGKTVVVNALLKVIENIYVIATRTQPSFKEYNYRNEFNKSLGNQNTDWLNAKSTYQYIDDFGFSEQTKIKLYGNEINCLTEIIYNRHSIWRKAKKGKAFFTSNMNPISIIKITNNGVAGRLREMCNVIHWEGEDLRLL